MVLNSLQILYERKDAGRSWHQHRRLGVPTEWITAEFGTYNAGLRVKNRQLQRHNSCRGTMWYLHRFCKCMHRFCNIVYSDAWKLRAKGISFPRLHTGTETMYGQMFTGYRLPSVIGSWSAFSVLALLEVLVMLFLLAKIAFLLCLRPIADFGGPLCASLSQRLDVYQVSSCIYWHWTGGAPPNLRWARLDIGTDHRRVIWRESQLQRPFGSAQMSFTSPTSSIQDYI